METRPLTLPRTIAEHYLRDARDFLSRFNWLWEKELHKTGRIKSFVDLVMACECGLKAHIFIGRKKEDPESLYRQVRTMSHDINKLAEFASYQADRKDYQFMKERLGGFSVFLRYSLDAYETFFPSMLDRENTDINYSKTIGNNAWVLEVRDRVESLLKPVSGELSGLVDMDIEKLLEHEQQMKGFVDACMK